MIVESGIAARTMAAYIDLNPVRAGMVADPAEYRWSSYGQAVGGGANGNGKYFTDGAVIGSKEFVNEAFAKARERFSAKRKAQRRGKTNARQWQSSNGCAVEHA